MEKQELSSLRVINDSVISYNILFPFNLTLQIDLQHFNTGVLPIRLAKLEQKVSLISLKIASRVSRFPVQLTEMLHFHLNL